MTKARDLSQTPNASLGFKNRIINGDMRIDQRNDGAAVTVNTTAALYSVDRFRLSGQLSDGVFSGQRVVDAPAGFVNSLKITVTTADSSLTSAQTYSVRQRIEGNNIADLAWGTASAAPVTLSFWVKSSVTGTFGGALNNLAFNRSYPYTYTINAANTWEYKTVTIAGDTSGTWETGTSAGITVWFGLGIGTDLSATAGSWASGGYLSATGATNLMATSSATWQLTGVQLEKGSTATSFDYRPYTTELQLAQRYYYKPNGGSMGAYISSTTVTAFYPFKVSMRATPTSSGTSATMTGTRPFVAGGITGQYDSAEAYSTEYYCINYSGLSSSASSGIPFVINIDDVQFSAEL